VASGNWTNGSLQQAGAATWANGTTGLVGPVTAANSLIGNQNDNVGVGGVTALTNGNYVVKSYRWNQSRGAATFGNGATGIKGVVSAANSLVGGSNSDGVGTTVGGQFASVLPLAGGNYVVISPYWDNAGATNAGAVTFGNGAGGVVGAVSATNSLVGGTKND